MNTEIWRAAIEGSLEAVWIIDSLSLRIRLANRAAEALLDFGHGSFDDLPIVELAATPEDIFFWEDVAAGLAHEIRSETLLRRADKSTISVERRVTLINLGGGESVYILAAHDLSEQRRVENELERLVAELRATLESTADGVLVVDLHGNIRSYNKRFADLWQLPELLLSERNDTAVFAWMGQRVINPESYANRLTAISRTPLLECTDTLALDSGRILERVTLPQYARGRPIGRVYSFRDITEQLAGETSRQLAAKVFEASLDAIFVTDGEFSIIAANPNCCRLTGLPETALLDRKADSLIFDMNDPEFADTLRERLSRDGSWEGDVWHLTEGNTKKACHLTVVQVADDAGLVTNFVGFFKDLTDVLEARKRIEQLAYSDVLTGLPNRLLLAERIQFFLNIGEREGTPFAVLFIDLDRFKQINDSLGHQFGDRVLIEVADRIKRCLRQADTVARLGGDEFVLLLHATEARGAELLARRIIDTLSLPLQIDEMTFTVTCSIGIALYPDDGGTMDDLIKNADSAMYHVKERGRSDVRFYQRQMNIDLLSRMKLDHAMRGALVNNGFRLFYQPQVDLQSGHIYGVEALIRWRDNELGEISPARFIPVAEETGIIVGIGNWVLNEAIRQAAQWQRDGCSISMAINVSALQFRQTDFVERILFILQTHDFPADQLELELTESILINDAENVLKRLQAIASLGVKLSIDDFGTGFSSLSYLKRFPLHRLKIDRSFVSDLPDNASDVAIVTAIIDLGRVMGFRVIAEGVENESQREFLRATGCHEFQGYLCSPALPADQLIARSREYSATATRAQGELFIAR